MTRFFRSLTPSSPVARNNWTIQNIDSIVAHFVLAIRVTDYELAVDDHVRHLDRGWIERDICGKFLIFVFWVVNCAGVDDCTFNEFFDSVCILWQPLLAGIKVI